MKTMTLFAGIADAATVGTWVPAPSGSGSYEGFINLTYHIRYFKAVSVSPDRDGSGLPAGNSYGLGGSVKVLVACEFSGIVREAFLAQGHDAWSCDLLPTEIPGNHFQGDVLSLLDLGWDLMIAHPPCTHLAVSGARWWKDKLSDQADALDFVRKLMGAPIKQICIENPISKISSAIRKPDQIIQPWQFGHGETKATCLWLKNLSVLQPTNIVQGRTARVHRMPPSPTRGKERSRTYPGIALAMAEQWGFHA